MKASWFNELGLNANYNMKREAITSNESQLNDDMLLPLIDDMMNCRKLWIDEVNEMFGTNWSIDWASSWEDNIEETELAQEIMESQIVESERSEDDEKGGDEDVDEKEDTSEDDVSSDAE